MKSYQNYLTLFDELNISEPHRTKIKEFLTLLRTTKLYTYKHSIRVSILAKKIGDYLKIDSKALFYAGLLHDIGKYKTPKTVLNKRGVWSAQDKVKMHAHVIDSYELLKGTFDFTAEVVIWHHKFQSDPYPETMPPLLHDYSEDTKKLIKYYGKLLSIADVYDALHRKNNRFGKNKNLTKLEIKEQLLRTYPNERDLIENLYVTGIFTL